MVMDYQAIKKNLRSV